MFWQRTWAAPPSRSAWSGRGFIERDYQPVFERYRILAPKIWVASIGAGGGSIAWIDPTAGLLKVGPQGAGAAPGPVAYGLGGTEPTVCDADVALGYLNPDYFLGGRLSLNKEGAMAAIEERIARPLDMSVVDAAGGIFRIINAHMSDLIRRCTVERGHDPREFTMVAMGRFRTRARGALRASTRRGQGGGSADGFRPRGHRVDLPRT